MAMPAVTSQAAQDPTATGDLKQKLDECLSRFDFEHGALLVQVPQFPLEMLDTATARGRGYFAYPPQNLLYLAATFRSLGIETRLVDLNYVVLSEAIKDDGNPEAAWQRALEEALFDFDSPLVCASLMFDTTQSSFERVCDFIRKRAPNSCIAAGGVAATADPIRLLNDGIDLVFSHEGELSLNRLYTYLRGESQELPVNLSFLNGDGQAMHTPEAPGSPVDLDIREEYDRIPISNYHDVGCLSNFSRMNGLEIPFATVVSRRGCRARCSFCGVRNFNGKGVRVRTTDGVIEEMVHLYETFGVRHFDWLDDDLLYNRDAAIELFQRIAEEMPEATWAANNGLIASAVTPEILDAMEASHCIGFKIGLESGNAKVLRDVHKPTSLEKFFVFADLAQDYPSMFASVNFIMGFPGERFFEMLDSFTAAIQGGLDWNSFFLYQHLKNTELYIAHGAMTDSDAEDNTSANNPSASRQNPVRGGLFRDQTGATEFLSGYDIMEFGLNLEPGQEQLKEMWFTFNFVVNFLRSPALYTEQEKRLKNGIRWMEALRQAYPEDPSMIAYLYYLYHRLGEKPASELNHLRDEAAVKIAKSEYWKRRDREFSISAFLDGEVPAIDSRVQPFMNPRIVDN